MMGNRLGETPQQDVDMSPQTKPCPRCGANIILMQFRNVNYANQEVHPVIEVCHCGWRHYTVAIKLPGYGYVVKVPIVGEVS